MESLERFRKVFSDAVEHSKKIEDEGYGLFTYFGPESVDSLQALQDHIGFNLPNSLKEFLLTHGPVQIGSEGSKTFFEIYCVRTNKCQTFKRFWERIDVELTTLLTPLFTLSEIDYLDQTYFIFGEVFLGSDNHEYLYVSNEGVFGTLLIYHDDDSGPIGVKQMIEGGGNLFGSLNELFSYCINLKIDRIYGWILDHDNQ